MPDRLHKSLIDTLEEVRACLEDLRALGLDELPVADLRDLAPCPPGTCGLDRGGAAACRQETPQEIRNELGDCQRCPLCRSRGPIVFGSGPPRARIVFVGGAPGKGEEAAGQPFSGELFERILFAMGLERSSVYTCTVVMCRPPQREPTAAEICACLPFLQRQIAAVAPTVIVAMGETATRVLTGKSGDFRTLRGAWGEYAGIAVMSTHDPAHLLLHPEDKRETWNDLKEVLRRLRHDD